MLALALPSVKKVDEVNYELFTPKQKRNIFAPINHFVNILYFAFDILTF